MDAEDNIITEGRGEWSWRRLTSHKGVSAGAGVAKRGDSGASLAGQAGRISQLNLGESDNTRDSAEEQRRESNVEAEVI